MANDLKVEYDEDRIAADMGALAQHIDRLGKELEARCGRYQMFAAALRPCLHTADGVTSRLKAARARRDDLMRAYLDGGEDAGQTELAALGEEIALIEQWGADFIGRTLEAHGRWVNSTSLQRAKLEEQHARLKMRTDLGPAYILRRELRNVHGRKIESA